MTEEVQAILRAFRDRGLRAGEFIEFWDFGDAIIWESGFVRDEAVRDALSTLVEDGHLVELNAGLELTVKGERQIYATRPQPRHGARIYLVDHRIIVKQVSIRGVPAEYAIDDERERHVDMDDDRDIADAVRAAISGIL